MTTNTYEVGFEHTAGGDSLLPPDSRGYYDGYTALVVADSAEAAERLGMDAMYADREENHPEFCNNAVDDLVARAWLGGSNVMTCPNCRRDVDVDDIMSTGWCASCSEDRTMNTKITHHVTGGLVPNGQTIRVDGVFGPEDAPMLDTLPDRTIVGVLTTEHPASSYGLPVLVVDGVAYGPDDIVSGVRAADACLVAAAEGDDLARRFVQGRTQV